MNNMPAIALGTWSWGSGFAGGDQVFGHNLTAKHLAPVFDAAMKAGLNLWDTAAVYGMGSSESILGEFVRKYPRNEMILSTKFTPQIANADSATPVADMLEESFERLGVDNMDIYWVHNPTDVNKWTPELSELLKKGKIKRVGVSNHNLEEIKLVNSTLAREGFGISAIQNHYSLLYRSSEEAGILDYCQRNGITFFAYMVLEQGALSGKYDTQHPFPVGSGRAETYNKALPQLETLVNAMRKIGLSRGASVAQVAIAWAIHKGTLPIIGVTKPSHVEDAAQAAKITLTAEEVSQLEELAAQTGADTRGSWELPMA